MCKYAIRSRELVCHHTSCHLTTDWDWSTSEETAPTSKSWRMERTWCFYQPTIRDLIDLTIKQIELWKSKLQYNGQLMQSIIDIENDMQSEHHVDIQVSSPSPWFSHHSTPTPLMGPGRSSNHDLSSESISSSPYRCWGVESLKKGRISCDFWRCMIPW